MTIKDLLAQGTQALAPTDQGDARRDVQVLLAHVLGVERITLYTYPELEVTSEQVAHFWQLLTRRQAHEPIAYLVGHKEFYGYDFLVDRHVLIPRPETELLVETAITTIQQKLSRGHIPIVADIGTGSGIIPITIALQEPHLPYIYACDLSAEALQVAQLNCQALHVEERVRLLQGDLLAPLPEPVDVLTANLPYIGTNEMDTLAPDVKAYEPPQALFSGPNGLDLLYRFCHDAAQPGVLKAEAVILLEIGYTQSESLIHLLQQLWPHAQIRTIKDYSGWDRLLAIVL